MIGATLANHGLPVTALRTNENSRNDATYVALMCRRPTRQTITEPSTQMTTIGAQVVAPLDAEQRHGRRRQEQHRAHPEVRRVPECRPRTSARTSTRSKSGSASAYGHRNGERTRMPTLMPVM